MRQLCFIIFFVTIFSCNQSDEETKKCILPTDVWIGDNCFVLEQGLWVYFKGFESAGNQSAVFFEYRFFPLIDSQGNDISNGSAVWANADGEGRILVPGKYLSGVSRFILTVEMFCDKGNPKAFAEFELKPTTLNCQAWELVTFSNSNKN